MGRRPTICTNLYKIMNELKIKVADAIRQVKSGVRWKPGKDRQHLMKRIRRGHLPVTTTLVEHETIILNIITHPDAFVYVYRYGSTDYPTVVAPYKDRVWLVMFSLDGIMETSFPPDKPDTYFDQDPRYIPMGAAREILL